MVFNGFLSFEKVKFDWPLVNLLRKNNSYKLILICPMLY